MKTLALELSTARGSLAWRENGNLAFTRDWPNDRKDSGPFFENLKIVSEKLCSPDKIVVGLGPGSYAGVRIAISAAIGLQTASGAQLLGYPSICAIECDASEYCVIGDARRQSFFFARVRNNDLTEGPGLLTENELRSKLDNLETSIPIFSCDRLAQFSRVELRYPTAELLARLAQDEHRSFALAPLEPMYLREPHITAPATH
ncbi:MAG: tRNA (adenosine(37)-N6)-threonylcarbamoyltransferase complex dimerization subunit type 1 TsaB [Chthoniobacterales bacterium]